MVSSLKPCESSVCVPLKLHCATRTSSFPNLSGRSFCGGRDQHMQQAVVQRVKAAVCRTLAKAVYMCSLSAASTLAQVLGACLL